MCPVYTDKKTNRLYIEFQYRGHRHKERLPEGTTKESAKKIEVKVKNDLMFQSHGIETRSEPTFEQFIKNYFGPMADRWIRDNPARWERTVLLVKAAMPFLKGKRLRSIKAADIERFKASRATLLTMHKTVRKPATIERELAIISNIFSIAVKNDLIDYNPCSRVTKLKYDNLQDKILAREDETKLFANMHSDWAKDICRMALYTGLRQNDIMNLTRFQVDRANKLISLVQRKTKRRVVVALNSVALGIINDRWRNGNKLLFPSPVTGGPGGSVRHAMLRACKRAKLPPLTIRDLRRTNATRKIENGADAVTVAESLGHSSLRMIPRYVRSLEMQRKAADSLVETPTDSPVAKNTISDIKVKSFARKR